MAASYRFIVSGQVQGVYFRQSTATQAQRLNLRGWVCNLPDGRVEGIAAGAEVALAELHQWLRSGPPLARVDTVEWLEDRDPLTEGFVVRR